jgi:hypothetical protein
MLMGRVAEAAVGAPGGWTAIGRRCESLTGGDLDTESFRPSSLSARWFVLPIA